MKIIYKIIYSGPDPVVFNSFKKNLSTLECEVFQVVNLKDIYSPLDDKPADLVLVDADYYGHEIWSLEAKVPLIMLSSRESQRQKAAEIGCADFLLRPFEPDELLIKVSTALLLSSHQGALEETGKFDHVLDAMQDGILVLNEKLEIEKANTRARDFFTDRSTLFLERIKDFKNNVEGSLSVVLVKGPLVFDLERPEAKDTRPLVLEARTNVIKDPFRNVIGVVVLLEDVTEKRKKSFQEEVFLNLISHKLKTPLSIVHKNAALFHQKVFGPLNADQEKFMGILYDKSCELVDSFEKLLGFTMIKTKRWDLTPEEISLGEHLAVIVETQTRKAKGRKLKFDLKIDPPDAVIQINRKYFDLILNNLIENALKFNDKETAEILLSAKRTQDGFEIEVRDNGCGIPPEDQERVFEEFYQVDKHRTLNVAGTGLGLSIVKYLTEACGGRIEIQSKLNEGSQFKLFLRSHGNAR